MMPDPDFATEAYALEQDSSDVLASFRERFHLLPGKIYLDGNSLGLLSKDAEAAVHLGVEQWRNLGIDGWLNADPDWFTLAERLGSSMAALVGAAPEEVVVSGTTTVNLHALVSTFYRPQGARTRIIATELDFPSDIYALQSQILLHGGDPERELIRVASHDGRCIAEADLIAAMTDEVDLALLPSVLYRSGQLLDMERLTAVAHQHGIVIGFDCAHSVGALPHELDAWDVDFAFWCTYKYLNAGPGATGALFVNQRHFSERPGLSGWWGYLKERQFDMAHHWQGAETAGAWQISTPPLLATIPLLGSLQLFAEAGIDRIRAKSLAQTRYLAELLVEAGLTDPPYEFRIGTPIEDHRRGGHLAIEHDAGAAIARALKARGIVPDFRPPDVVRLAPIAFTNTWHELWRTVQALREIIDSGEQMRVEQGRSLVA